MTKYFVDTVSDPSATVTSTDVTVTIENLLLFTISGAGPSFVDSGDEIFGIGLGLKFHTALLGWWMRATGTWEFEPFTLSHAGYKTLEGDDDPLPNSSSRSPS